MYWFKVCLVSILLRSLIKANALIEYAFEPTRSPQRNQYTGQNEHDIRDQRIANSSTTFFLLYPLVRCLPIADFALIIFNFLLSKRSIVVLFFSIKWQGKQLMTQGRCSDPL